MTENEIVKDYDYSIRLVSPSRTRSPAQVLKPIRYLTLADLLYNLHMCHSMIIIRFPNSRT